MNIIFKLALFGLAIALAVKIFNDLDLNKVIYHHSPGKCRYVEGIDTPGSEDLILLSNNLAVISSGVYLPVSTVKINGPGKLYLYNPLNDAAKAESLTIKSDQQGFKPDEFFPLGVTAWEEKGQTTIYVINSLTKEIYVFDLKISERQLIHKKTLSHPSISNPNNLIAVGKDKFYITNFVHYSHPVGMIAEFIQKLPFGTVWFYDGNEFVKVLDGLKGPNGVAVSKTKKHLLLATHMDESLRVYRIEPTPAHTNLTQIHAINLYTGVDNINVDSQGAVWLGAHPIAYRSVMHMIDSDKNSAPSQVLKITFNLDHSQYRVEEEYADDGDQLSGSTVAALTSDGRKLLIGSLMKKTLVCTVEK